MSNEELLKKIQELEYRLNKFERPESYLFKEKLIKIGINTSSLLAFFGLTPITQPLSTGETTGVNPSGTTLGHTSTFTGNTGSTAYTLSDVVKHLKNLGIIKK